MGLRLPWEITASKTLRFDYLGAVPVTRQRSWRVKGTKHEGLDIGLDVENLQTQDIKRTMAHLNVMQKISLDRAKKDFLSGIQCLLTSSCDEALLLFNQASARDDEMADAHFALALYTGEAQEQLAAVERVLVQKKNFTRLFKEAGIMLYGSLRACDGKSIRMMSDFPGLELLAAEVYQNHGKLEAAKRLLEQSQYAELDIFRFSCGDLLYRLQQYEEAIDTVKKLKDSPLAGPASYLMGLSLEQLGYFSTAVQVYRSTLKTVPVSLLLEVALRTQLYHLLLQEGKAWLAQREKETLAALTVQQSTKA